MRLSVSEARALGEAALARIGYGDDDARIITDQLIDNSLCGYRFAGLSGLVKAIQATPRRPGVEEIRIPSQRAFRERERRRAEGILVDGAVIAALEAL